MKITVKTIEWLSHHLPDNREGDQAEIEVAQGTTPDGVIAQLALSTDRRYIIEVNGTVVPHGEHGKRSLAAGDLLTILPEPKVGM